MQSGEERKAFRPYIPTGAKLRELTWGPLMLGTLLGVIFGLSSLYLVLKVGMTVSASIPVAVISITFFRLLTKVGRTDATILENNIVQTAGSAGESIAFGVGVTMPAIMILGFELEFWRVALVAVLGGLLGILMMIPLRRALIVEQHGTLKYPEGTACAEVLKAGASDESRRVHLEGEAADEVAGEAKGYRKVERSAEAEAREKEEIARARAGGKVIFTGFGIGLLYKTVMTAFKGWKDVPEVVFGSPLKSGSLSAEISPELLGVGYIIGPKIAAVMCGGGVLAYLVLIPAIKFFGDGLICPLPPGNIPISQMAPDDIRGAYVLYIGAGAVAAGGIVSLVRSLPTIWHGLKGGLKDLRRKKDATADAARPRVDRDMSMRFVIFGSLALVVAIVAAPPLHMNPLGAVLIVVLGFLFVTVSSRLTGEIGSSSNPISGMTVATLLLTCIVFLILGWTGPAYYVTALSVGAIVCIAASNGGTTSQDLKTGYLVGATPRLQQIAILFGALASALALGPVLLVMNQGATVYVPRTTFEAPAVERPALSADEVATLKAYAGELPPNSDKQFLRYTQAAPPQGTEALPDELPPGDYLVDPETRLVAFKVGETFSPDLRVDPAELADAPSEKLSGPQAKEDGNEYKVWHKTNQAEAVNVVGWDAEKKAPTCEEVRPADEAANAKGPTAWGPEGKYLVTADGVPKYLVDPGVNGVHKVRPDGSKVTKFDAPKATLMSYIIKGILNRKLPWGLVLLGVMIALVLELAGIPSLAFAVGVYLPLSSSTPILVGGAVRFFVDRWLKRKHAGRKLTEDELNAEGDKSPGVLLASGYIAGGAITGIVVLLVTGAFGDIANKVEEWSTAHNPFFNGGLLPSVDANGVTHYGIPAELLSMIPFVLITFLLWLAGRELWLRPPKSGAPPGATPKPKPKARTEPDSDPVPES